MSEPIPSQVEALIRSLARYDWRSSSIWRHYYPSVTGTYVKVEDLVAGLKQIIHELESEKGSQHD